MWISKKKLHDIIDNRVQYEVALQIDAQLYPVAKSLEAWRNKTEKSLDIGFEDICKRSKNWEAECKNILTENHKSALAHHKLIEGWLREIRDFMMKRP